MLNGEISLKHMYFGMKTIREFEEKTLELSHEGHIAGSVHLALGQEAIPIGAIAALEPQDRVLATYRGHGWAIAKGAPLEGLFGEVLQRATGVNGGRSGSPLLSHPESGFLGENSIVGAGLPIADGVALASKLQGTRRVVVTSFGDGAVNQGSSYEGMVFAAVNRLPVIFVCENNGWSEMTPTNMMIQNSDVSSRPKGIGIETLVVDGCDPEAVRDAVSYAAQKCRDNEGPIFIECKTVRLKGHYNKDIEHYRPQEDRDAAVGADPLLRARNKLVDSSALNLVEDIDQRVVATVEAAAQTALNAPWPEVTTAFDHLYGDDIDLAEAVLMEEAEMTYWKAVNLALRTELEQRQEVVVYGEDVANAGGIFGVTRGLQKEFGAQRVFDTPITESAILGSAVGAALEGLRPVVEIMWADFLFVAFDQIINQASNVRYINESRLNAPMTVRMQQGVTPGSCSQHSQSIEAFLAHIPGIKVGLPSTPQDAYDMLRAAIADPDPTVIIEHRSLYLTSGPVQQSATAVQRAEGAKLRRQGRDGLVISWGAMLSSVLDAAERLSSDGFEVGVLDLRWITPLDMGAIEAALTGVVGNVFIVHEATLTGGFGAELSARITEAYFDQLQGPVQRLATPDLRMPSSPALQEKLVPSAESISEWIAQALR